MNNNEKDFIALVSSFLNSSTPENKDYDWKEIFNLAYINNIVGIISSQIVALPNVDKKIKFHYKKYVAKSVVDYEHRQKVKEKLKSIFEENSFDYMFVKGMAIGEYYPVPELRTSGDIDVIVKPDQFEKVYDALNNEKCNSLTFLPFVIEAEFDDVTIEIHKDADVFGHYYDTPFAFARNNGCQYCFDLYHQLLYILLHLVKHLQATGAGIRMLMDIDVCVRAIDDFDQQKFLDMCQNAGVGHCAEVLLSLCNYWFDTPIMATIKFDDDLDLVNSFVNAFLHGGTFGFENNDYSGIYLSAGSKSGKIGFKERIRAFFAWLFPPVSIIKKVFHYANKYPFLIPFAYFHRFINGISANKKHTSKTFKGIVNPNSASISISKILAELNLND